MLARHDPHLLLVEFVDYIASASITLRPSFVSLTIVNKNLGCVSANLLSRQLDSRIQNVDEVEFGLNLLFKSFSEVIVLHGMATLLQKLYHGAQVHMFRHLSQEYLVPDQHKFFELHFLFVAFTISRAITIAV